MSENIRPLSERVGTRLRRRRVPAARLIGALGPATIVGGVAWGFLQPYRIVFLSGEALSVYDWIVQPPLLVIAVGLVFSFAVVPGLLQDLEGDDPTR
ncbi:MAG: hypothetical protein EXQ81_02245 [Thermoleophilia bacterium]|nr:hypothetical protein [Thermoleophilia bacterium]